MRVEKACPACKLLWNVGQDVFKCPKCKGPIK